MKLYLIKLLSFYVLIKTKISIIEDNVKRNVINILNNIYFTSFLLLGKIYVIMLNKYNFILFLTTLIII